MGKTRRAKRPVLLTLGLFFIVVAVPLLTAALPRDRATGTATTGLYDNGVVLPNGRLVTPAGRTSDLGDFPMGGAISPDGRLSVAVNSGQGEGLNLGYNSYCEQGQGPGPCPYVNPAQPLVAATAGYSNTRTYDNSLSVTDLRSGRARTVTAVPTSYNPVYPRFNYFYAGVVFSPDGRHLYASGGGNDAVYDFPVRHDIVASRPITTVVLADNVRSQLALPIFGAGSAYTKGLAVTPDGRYILVAHEYNNTLDIVDARTYASSEVMLGNPTATGGASPYGVAVSPIVTTVGSVKTYTAYVSEQGLGVVGVVSIANGTGMTMGTIPAGDHPTGLAVSPDGSQVYVANVNDDTLSILSTASNTRAATVALQTLPDEQLGAMPDAVAVSPDGQRIYVALAGDDAVAVLGTMAGFTSGVRGTGRRASASPAATSFVVGGMIPTGWYPTAVNLSPDGSTVYIVSGKGLGSRYVNPAFGGPRRGSITSSFEYDGNNMPGLLQAVPAPTMTALAAGLSTARADIMFATNVDNGRTAHNPIPAQPLTGTVDLPSTASPATPIKHVIEVVRENRTFDQVLGDVPSDQDRPGVNGYNGYTIFGRDVTPNAHALVGDIAPASTTADPAFATSDNFFSDGEASVQGHWWTAAATVSDYVEKTWRQNYSYLSRGRFYDPVSPISSPRNCSIFQTALKKQVATANQFTVRDYGELIGIASPDTAPGLSLGPTCAALPNASVDPNAATDEITLDQDGRSVVSEFLNDVGLNADGSQQTTVAGALNTLRTFSYLTLAGDHTGGLAFTNTPRSRVAQNDGGLGLLVQAVSHSKYWSDTAIFVMEDDSQDGLDHVDGHRNLLYVISPYAKHLGADSKPGYVGHLHYSQASVLKTIELILGLPYLSTYDQNASALYDLFQNKDGVQGYTLTAQDLTSYNLQPVPRFIDETSASVKAAMGAAADAPAALSRTLNLSGLDRAGPALEIVDWMLARPDRAVPAPLLEEMAGWNLRHGLGNGDD